MALANITNNILTDTGVLVGSLVPTSRTLTINGTAFNLSADRSWSVGTVTSVAALTLGTTGTDLSSSVATGTTTPVITLNVPTASAANRGALSATDWSTFNTKVGVGFVSTGTLFARTAFTTYRDHSSSAANDAPLKSLSNTEDNWIYCDSADAQWGIYHRNIDTALVVAGQPTLPANSIAFIGANVIASYTDLANGNGFYRGSVTANSIVKNGGTSSQFLMADGSVNTSVSPSGAYLPLVGGTLTGRLTIDLAGNGYGVLMNRTAITNFIGIQYQTANSNKWFVGLRETSTNNYFIYNESLGTDAFSISLTNNSATFSGAYAAGNGININGTTYATLNSNRGGSAASAGVNYSSVNVQKWFTGIYENTDNFGFYSTLTNGFPLTITPAGLTTFTKADSSHGLARFVGSANEASIGFRFPADGDATSWVIGKGAGEGNTTFGFYYGGTKMILTPTGNLGIGANAPTNKLHILGNGANTQNIMIESSIAAANAFTLYKNTSKFYFTGLSSDLSNSYIIYDATIDTPRLTISSVGNVGIGGTPLQALDRTLTNYGSIISNPTGTGGNYNENFRGNRAGNGYSAINMGGASGSVSGTGTGIWTLVAPPAGEGYRFYWDYAGTDVVSFSTGGAVTARGGFFDISDSRLKTLIEDNYLLSSIANVKAKLYLKNGKEELGYYAQDLQEILPSAVNEGVDGFLSLSYTQVHTAKISVIENEVDILKRRVSELEFKIQKYEA